MSTPIPTPFDIVNPPAGPIVPSLTSWILPCLLILSVLLLRSLLLRRSRPPSVERLLSSLLDELKRTLAQPQSELTVARFSRLAKRIISPYVARDIDTLSSSEMRTFAASLSTSPEDRLRSAASLLTLLAELEEITYAPRESSARVTTLTSQLSSALDEHVRRHRPQ